MAFIFKGAKGLVLPKLIIKNVNELPSWFKIEKYEAAKTLDATGWFEQLTVRRIGKSYFDEDLNDGSDSSLQSLEALDLLRATPIIDVDNNFLIKVLFEDGRLYELKTGDPHRSLGVHMTSVREHYQTEKNIENEKRDYARNFFAQNWGKNWLTKPVKYKWKDWIDQPIDNIRSRPDFNVNIRIDMGLPDKVLIEQFKYLLKNLREPLQELGLKIDNRLRPDFDGWAKFGVLPYLDLASWAKMESVQIPSRVMADAIFPAGEGGEEVVRKTTKKLAKEILTESHLNKLATLAAYEIAERNTGKTFP